MSVGKASQSRNISRRDLLRGALFTALAAGLAFASSLLNGFVWDDHVFLKKLQDEPYQGISDIFVEPYAHGAGEFEGERIYYRPLCSIVYWTNYSLFGHEPFGYHLVNVLLHAAVCAAVYLLFIQMTGRPGTSLVAGILFAVHPVHAENVAWISGLTDPLCALFLVGALLAGLRATREDAEKWWTLASLSMATFALLAKELAVVFVPLLLVLSLSRNEFDSRRLGILSAAGSVLTLGFILWRRWILGHLAVFSGRVVDLTPTTLLTAAKNILANVYIFLFPWWSSPAIDSTPVNGALDPAGLFSALTLAAITFLAIRSRRSALGWGWCFFVVSLLPSSGIVPIGDTLAERFLYVPSIGLSVVVVEAARHSVQSFSSRWWVCRDPRFLVGGSFVVLSCLTILTAEKARTWVSDLAFFEAAAQSGASDSMYWFNYGLALEGAGRSDEAKIAYKEAVERGKEIHLPLNNLGSLALKRNKPQEAEKYLREALRHQPQYGPAWLNLAEALIRLERPEESLACVESALRHSPELAHKKPAALHFLLGRCFAITNPERALPHLSTVIEMNPDDPQARMLRGTVYATKSMLNEAIADFRTVIEQNPGMPQAWRDLGRALAFQGDYPAAKDAYKRALALHSEDIEVCVDLAAVLIEMERCTEAVTLLQDVLTEVPNHGRARTNLGLAFYKLGEPKKAVDELRTAARLTPENPKPQELLRQINEG